MKKVYLKAFVLLFLIIQAETTKSQFVRTEYDVGVFYMPWWHYPGTDPMQGNWRYINDYDAFLIGKGLSDKARMPLPNYSPSPVWYDEKMASVTESQFELMKNNEIDFVVIDSYWNFYNSYNDYGGSYQQVLENLVEPGFNFHGMDFAIMWANDFKEIVVQSGCQRYLSEGLGDMTSYWSQFINHSRYKKIDGKPAFYIYYPSMPEGSSSNNIEGIGTYCMSDPFFAPLGSDVNDRDKRTKFLLERIEQLVGQELYFVAVMTPDAFSPIEDPNTTIANYTTWLINHPQNAGFDAVTSYGYKYFDRADAWSNSTFTLCNGAVSNHNWNYDYTTMQGVYSDFYTFMLANSNLKYQMPVSAGWNRGPITMDEVINGVNNGFGHPCNNYSLDPLDQAVATPALFEQSLITARNMAYSNSTKSKNIIMLSAWNEYAEGTVIEPNHQWGGQFLQKVKDVFSCNIDLITPLYYRYIDNNGIEQSNPVQQYYSVPNNVVCALSTTFHAYFSIPGATSVIPELVYASDPGIGWGSNNGLDFSLYSYFTGYGQQIIFKITATSPCGTEVFNVGFRSEECYSPYQYSIFPNPAGDEISVEQTFDKNDKKFSRSNFSEKSNRFKVKLYNEKGTVLRQGENNGQLKISFNTRDLPNGTYYLHITEGKNVIKKQVIIQH